MPFKRRFKDKYAGSSPENASVVRTLFDLFFLFTTRPSLTDLFQRLPKDRGKLVILRHGDAFSRFGGRRVARWRPIARAWSRGGGFLRHAGGSFVGVGTRSDGGGSGRRLSDGAGGGAMIGIMTFLHVGSTTGQQFLPEGEKWGGKEIFRRKGVKRGWEARII